MKYCEYTQLTKVAVNSGQHRDADEMKINVFCLFICMEHFMLK